jgi:hypothetical protein
VAVTLRTCIQKVLGSHLRRISPAIPTKLIREDPQAIQRNSGIVSRLGHDRFLPSSLLIRPLGATESQKNHKT